ncbi:hypothetical protein NEPAR06_2283 [Nematocida parisii]|uniref:Nucleolar complex-associated protein 3 N-terminal domain-containing protein n=1 Tax=Nematocida parisii (strain ERTm3) TaxID=935791 RepID=I3EJ25_NEMP3|nr:uncharacterized protein NEPG_01570 [Nematocida parisii ERTm1]EIJ89222.1 hypothetical protein NEQG_01041 [Nematocida parisii ERTm3]KAI5130026.1 hypothetical protein NEPAR08_1817 [Nematocida parisii]EIJ93228.1 hypothetical protein NEPG_01570 [Nematocida parisii ERTm1]KAI5130974.1 hypothetical protein NEPAR03_2259 [Nematocida parisii]KAI5143061.1 hypothetical protein NEPAR04_1726 [Nematocida parisii]|eukprot:XP_013059398.1 hypothetical protein NEPG_01570 [Nematocida parisii ERTm1]
MPDVTRSKHFRAEDNSKNTRTMRKSASAEGAEKEANSNHAQKRVKKENSSTTENIHPNGTDSESIPSSGKVSPLSSLLTKEDLADTEKAEDGSDKLNPKHAFMAAVSAALANPTEKTLGDVTRHRKILQKKKEMRATRLLILALAKVFFNLLPSYNIRTQDHKYNASSKITSYEYALMKEWAEYLKLITRSKTEESYEAAAILLPQAILFNKSMKLIGKVIKGTRLKSKIGKKCHLTLVQIFSCDRGNRTVKVLEVMDQIAENLPKPTIRALFYIPDSLLTKPERTHKYSTSEMRKLSVEEKAIKKEAQLHFLPEEIKAWKGISERLLRIYLLILSSKPIQKHYYALTQIQRLSIPGHLKEGVFTLLTEKAAELKAEMTPKNAAILCLCYITMHKIYGDAEYSFHVEEMEKIPVDVIVQMSDSEASILYAAIMKLEKHSGRPRLIKMLLARGMHRVDKNLAAVVRHLMPREGAARVEKESENGFWEMPILVGKRRG